MGVVTKVGVAILAVGIVAAIAGFVFANTVTTPGGDGTTDPGTKPENPGIDPEDPGTSPEYPWTGPDEPGMPGTPGEPHMPSDPADPNQPTDPATPGTSTEPADEMSPVVPAAGQVQVQTGFAATDSRGVVSADLAGVAEGRSMAGTWAGAKESGAASMSASGMAPSVGALAQTGANSGSLVWFGGALVLLGLAALGLRRSLGAK